MSARLKFALAVVLCGVFFHAGAAPAVDFDRQVRPILSDNCFACHGPDEKQRMAKLRLDVKEGMFADRGGHPVIIPGDAAASRLFQRIGAKEKQQRMPPPYSERTLTDQQIDLIRKWIDQGATWEMHWAYVAPKRPDAPRVRRPLAGNAMLSFETDGVRVTAALGINAQRDIAAVMYAGDPLKKRLDVVLAAWRRAHRGDEQLVVTGTGALEPTEGVTLAGRLAPADYRALLRRARVFVAAPRREDYGIAPLEALADGCLLVTTPAPGPYPALGLARQLDPRLVSDDLVTALRTALDSPRPGYGERAAALLTPFRRAAVDRTIADDVLPLLLPGCSP